MTVERMIELLEIEKECVLRNASGECNRYCAGCDLLQDDTELHEMYTEAIALLKAQEPRVMTLVEAQGADYCWYESKTAGVCFLVSAVMYHASNGKPKTEFQQMGTEILGFQYDDEYGKYWRCWDKEPTREIREATPWG